MPYASTTHVEDFERARIGMFTDFIKHPDTQSLVETSPSRFEVIKDFVFWVSEHREIWHKALEGARNQARLISGGHLEIQPLDYDLLSGKYNCTFSHTIGRIFTDIVSLDKEQEAIYKRIAEIAILKEIEEISNRTHCFKIRNRFFNETEDLVIVQFSLMYYGRL